MHPQDSIDFLSATESMISIHSDSVEDTIQVKRLKQLCRLRSPLFTVISANFPNVRPFGNIRRITMGGDSVLFVRVGVA